MKKKSFCALFMVSMLTLISSDNLITDKSVGAKLAPETKEISDGLGKAQKEIFRTFILNNNF